MYTPVFGKYGGPEFSVIVFHNSDLWKKAKDSENAQKGFMVHHQDVSEHEIVRDLGKKYNQEAVIHSQGKKNEMHYTTGADAGKFVGGSDYEFAPSAKDFYSRLHLTKPPKKGESSKFRLNFAFGEKLKPVAEAIHKVFSNLMKVLF
jgi:hypothetical protein